MQRVKKFSIVWVVDVINFGITCVQSNLMAQSRRNEIRFARRINFAFAVGSERARATNDNRPLRGVRVFRENNFLIRAHKIYRAG